MVFMIITRRFSSFRHERFLQHFLMKKLLIASNNDHKFQEFSALLAHLPLHLVKPIELGIELDVAETGESYYSNALIKARAFHQASGLPVLADDSGLEVVALDGAPSIHSHRFVPIEKAADRDRCFYLLGRLAEKPQPWIAAFQCTAMLYINHNEVYSSHGICPGQIITDYRGENGFGYDPIFLLAGQNLTMAELSSVLKNQLSHRARAIQGFDALRDWALQE